MYLVIVVIFFYTQIPLHIIQPVFYADPMGAIIGKGLTKLYPQYNPQWIGKKTIGGTMAVFITSIITLTYIITCYMSNSIKVESPKPP